MSKPSERLLRYRPNVESLAHFFGDDALEAFMLFSLKEAEYDATFLSKIFGKPVELDETMSPFQALLNLTEDILGQKWQRLSITAPRRPGASGLPRHAFSITKGDHRLMYLISYLPGPEPRDMQGSIVITPVKHG